MATQVFSITDSTPLEVAVDSGKRYGYAISGDFSSAVITVEADGIILGEHAEAAGQEVYAVSNTVTFTSAAISPDLTVKVTIAEQ